MMKLVYTLKMIQIKVLQLNIMVQILKLIMSYVLKLMKTYHNTKYNLKKIVIHILKSLHLIKNVYYSTENLTTTNII